MFSARTNVNKAVVLRCDFPQWLCLFFCLAKLTYISEKPQQRASKCIKKHRGDFRGGVDTQGVSELKVMTPLGSGSFACLSQVHIWANLAFYAPAIPSVQFE